MEIEAVNSLVGYQKTGRSLVTPQQSVESHGHMYLQCWWIHQRGSHWLSCCFNWTCHYSAVLLQHQFAWQPHRTDHTPHRISSPTLPKNVDCETRGLPSHINQKWPQGSGQVPTESNRHLKMSTARLYFICYTAWIKLPFMWYSYSLSVSALFQNGTIIA